MERHWNRERKEIIAKPSQKPSGLTIHVHEQLLENRLITAAEEKV